MFNEIIVENFSNPTFAAELGGADHVIELGNPVCGDRIKVELKVKDGVVETARYQAWGCATSVATGNLFCAHLEGRPLALAASTPEAQIEGMLGEIEPSQHHCLDMLKLMFARLPGLAADVRGED